MPPPRRIPATTTPANQQPSLVAHNETVSNLLAQRYDTLNQLFVLAESQLRALKPLRPVWIRYDVKQIDGGPSRWDLLALTKIQDKWRLVHAWDHNLNDDSPPLDIKPIIECPIEVRVRAAQEVRELHAAIVADKERFIPEVEAAIVELVNYCQGLGPAPNS